MQQTCSQCGGLLAPGAQNCTYCGKPVASAYPQQNVSQNPYGSYQQGNAGASNAYPPPYTQYATQGTYSTQAAPSAPQPSVYNQPAYGAPSQPYGSAPQSGYDAPPQSYGGSAPQPVYSAPPQPYSAASQPAFGASPQPFGSVSQPPIIPSQPPAQRRSSGALIGVILAIIVVLAGLGIGGYFLFLKQGGSTTTTSGTPTPIPPLYQANLTKDPGNWDCSDAKCSFRADGYHIQALDNYVYTAYLTKVFADTTIEVKAIMTQGVVTSGTNTSAMGIAFRVPQSNKLSGYGFLVYADGTYDLVKWDDKGNSSHLVDLSESTAIHKGLNQENDLKLVIQGTSFMLFINGQQLTQTTDSTYTSGYIGLNASTKGTEVIYSNLLVTKP